MLYFDQFKSQLLNFSNSECTPEMPIGSEKNPNILDYKVNLNWVNIDYLTDLIGFNLKIYNNKLHFYIAHYKLKKYISMSKIISLCTLPYP